MAGDLAGEQWLELIRAFGGTKELHVVGQERLTEILCALRSADETVLPTMHSLRVSGLRNVGSPLWDAAESFLASRQLYGRPIELNAILSCHICFTYFTRQQELKRHLVDQHSFRIYCGDFECKPDLAGRHPTALDIFGPFTRLQAPSSGKTSRAPEQYYHNNYVPIVNMLARRLPSGH